MRYAFEVKKEITACFDCPLSDDLYCSCNLKTPNKDMDLKKQFEECSLEVIKNRKT